MRTLFGLGLLIALAGATRPCAAQDGLRLEVSQDPGGETRIVVLDPATLRLAVYACTASDRLRLVAVRNLEYDLRFEEYTPRGKEQTPPVGELRDAVRESQQPAPVSPAAVVAGELELRALRETLNAAKARGQEPSWKGLPLEQRVRELERQVTSSRLSLALREGLAQTDQAVAAELQRRRDEATAGLAACKALLERLEPEHGGRAAIAARQEELRAERDAAQALLDAQAGD